jgi:hypothetical protein
VGGGGILQVAGEETHSCSDLGASAAAEPI